MKFTELSVQESVGQKFLKLTGLLIPCGRVFHILSLIT